MPERRAAVRSSVTIALPFRPLKSLPAAPDLLITELAYVLPASNRPIQVIIEIGRFGCRAERLPGLNLEGYELRLRLGGA